MKYGHFSPLCLGPLRVKPLLAALFVCSGVAWSATTESSVPIAKKPQLQTEQRGTESTPLLVKGEVTTKETEESAREHASERKNREDVDATLVRYTKHLAIATYLLFAFTAGLFGVTYKLSRDANKETQQRSEETTQSERAYLGIKEASFELQRLSSSAARILARIAIVNAGKTMANSVRLAIEVKILDSDNGPMAIKYRNGETYLAPGFTWNVQKINEDMNISPEIGKEIVVDSRRVILWGELSYRDVFGNDRRSSFRFRQGTPQHGQVPGAAMTIGIVGWDVYPCEEGNEAT